MTDIHDIAIKVVSQKGHCAQNHKVGDNWAIRGYRTPNGRLGKNNISCIPFLP